MPIYSNGKKAKKIYAHGQAIKKGYSYNQLVYTTVQGWVLSGTVTINITSANNNTITGSVTLNRYDYYEGSQITENYYEVASISASRLNEGVMDLPLDPNASVYFGNSNISNPYSVPASGVIRLNASEISHLYCIKNPDGGGI
jgi:hypothetical protein